MSDEKIAQLIGTIVRGLADDESAVGVSTVYEDGHLHFRVTVGPNDFGKVIGRRGQNVDAIRFLVNAVGNKYRLKTCAKPDTEPRVCAHVFVEDPNPDRRGNRDPSLRWRTR